MRPGTKYYPLYEHLGSMNRGDTLKLSFDKIESIIGARLPRTARANRAWWANSATPQGRAWLEAGWVVDAVDIEEEWVIFRGAHVSYRLTPRRRRVAWGGEQIKALREFAGWSQQELADQLGMRQQTISEWETGKYYPRRSTGVLLEFIAERVGFYQATRQEKP